MVVNGSLRLSLYERMNNLTTFPLDHLLKPSAALLPLSDCILNAGIAFAFNMLNSFALCVLYDTHGLQTDFYDSLVSAKDQYLPVSEAYSRQQLSFEASRRWHGAARTVDSSGDT